MYMYAHQKWIITFTHVLTLASYSVIFLSTPVLLSNDSCSFFCFSFSSFNCLFKSPTCLLYALSCWSIAALSSSQFFFISSFSRRDFFYLFQLCCSSCTLSYLIFELFYYGFILNDIFCILLMSFCSVWSLINKVLFVRLSLVIQTTKWIFMISLWRKVSQCLLCSDPLLSSLKCLKCNNLLFISCTIFVRYMQ